LSHNQRKGKWEFLNKVYQNKRVSDKTSGKMGATLDFKLSLIVSQTRKTNNVSLCLQLVKFIYLFVCEQTQSPL